MAEKTILTARAGPRVNKGGLLGRERSVKEMMVDDGPGIMYARNPGQKILEAKSKLKKAEKNLESAKTRRSLFGGGKGHYGFGGMGVSDEGLRDRGKDIGYAAGRLRDLKTYGEKLYGKGKKAGN